MHGALVEQDKVSTYKMKSSKSNQEIRWMNLVVACEVLDTKYKDMKW